MMMGNQIKLDRKLDDIEKELIAIESKVDKIEEIVNQLLKKIDNRHNPDQTFLREQRLVFPMGRFVKVN